jgi:hypothetical protein
MTSNKLNWAGILIICVSLSACVKLNENLTGQPTTDKFFQTITDFQSYISGAYTPLFNNTWTSTFGTDYAFIAEAGAEDVHTVVSRWQGFEEININSVANPNEVVDPLWNNAYTSISICNTMLSVIQQSKLDTTLTSPIAGEAKFLRALNYFFLVRWFGEVPILTETNQIQAATSPQMPVSDIYSFIVSDLLDAASRLPATQADVSKPTTWAARALLAKVYLAMAGFPLNQASAYAMARDMANEVITANQYTLVSTGYADLWNWDYRMTNTEFIFTLYANSSNGGGSYIHMAVRPFDHGEGGWGDWQTDKRFLAEFPAGDSNRLNGTFYLTMLDGTNWANTDYAEPYVAKWRNAGPKSGYFEGPPVSTLADGFTPLIRYADILLVYAESANQAEGSPSAAAYAAINQVRARSGFAPLAGLSNADFDQAVLDERNWELAFEHNRWFDLCRRHMLQTVMQSWYPNSTIDDHNYLLPKPTDQLAIMKGVSQNPGY